MLLVFIFGVALVTVIPDLLFRGLGFGCWKRQYSPGVVITFNGGPDPITTPKILDDLDKYGAKAIFFVTAENACSYPDLVMEIKNRGHQIGTLFNSRLRDWLLYPCKTWRDWAECDRTMGSLTRGTANNLMKIYAKTFFPSQSGQGGPEPAKSDIRGKRMGKYGKVIFANLGSSSAA